MLSSYLSFILRALTFTAYTTSRSLICCTHCVRYKLVLKIKIWVDRHNISFIIVVLLEVGSQLPLDGGILVDKSQKNLLIKVTGFNLKHGELKLKKSGISDKRM